jgi:hypothetical protein
VRRGRKVVVVDPARPHHPVTASRRDSPATCSAKHGGRERVFDPLVRPWRGPDASATRHELPLGDAGERAPAVGAVLRGFLVRDANSREVG